MKIKIRFLALVTLFVILLSAYMTNVSAASSGTCGDNLNWELDNGVLTISGYGEMYNYAGNKAPWEKESVKNVVVSYGVTSIGDYAFWGCSNLTCVTIPNSVTSIGDCAFVMCFSLTSLTIPDSVTSIGDHAFSSCSLTSMTIPDSVTSIAWGAFWGCSNLTCVTIPDSVTSIGGNAFSGCRSLTSVTIPDSVTSIGYGAFQDCSRLTSVKIPDGVTSIGGRIFQDCSNLTDVTIPGGVTLIGHYAFSGCSSLTSLTIPDSVTSIGEGAFSDTGYYNESSNWENGVLYIGNCLIGAKNTISCTIKDGTRLIGDSVLENHSSLTSVTIPGSVTSIGMDAFSGCSSLTSVTIPDSVTSIGGNAFYNTGYYNESSNWENGVLYIGNCLIAAKKDTISYCAIKDGTRLIGSLAFRDCRALEWVVLPDHISNIDDAAFDGCDNCVLYCADNKYVEDYAAKHSLGYVNTASDFELKLTPPEKTEYYTGDTLDLTGMALTAAYDAEHEIKITQGYEVSGFNSAVPGEQTVTITYKNKSVSYQVFVDVRGCKAISVTPPTKKTYYIGQELDLTGMVVTAYYESERSEVIIDGYMVTGYNPTVLGVQTITVAYGSFTAEFEITLIERSIESISVAETSKKKYYVGDEFDYAATTIILHYNDGETTEISAEDDKIVISGFDSSAAAENQKISVTYAEKLTAEFTISIAEPEKPLTHTTYRKVSNHFRFHVEYSDLIDNAVVAVSIVDKTGKILGISSVKCDGDDRYTLNIPFDEGAVIANIFTWNSIDRMQPLAIKETIQLN